MTYHGIVDCISHAVVLLKNQQFGTKINDKIIIEINNTKNIRQVGCNAWVRWPTLLSSVSKHPNNLTVGHYQYASGPQWPHNTHTLGEDQLHLAKAHPVHSAAINKKMLALIFFFYNKIRLACLHHVPLFKFIEQFQPFNPNQQMAKMRIFTRLLQKQWSIPMQSVEKKVPFISY